MERGWWKKSWGWIILVDLSQLLVKAASQGQLPAGTLGVSVNPHRGKHIAFVLGLWWLFFLTFFFFFLLKAFYLFIFYCCSNTVI